MKESSKVKGPLTKSKRIDLVRRELGSDHRENVSLTQC